MTRKEYLLELIDEIYGKGNRRVNYEYNLIHRQSGLGDKVNQKIFNNRKSMGSYAEQFKRLFTLTFVEDGVEFELPYGNGDFSRGIAFINARVYLRNKGVDFLLSKDLIVQDYDHMIISFLNEYIIPAIFYSYTENDDTYDYDETDIGEEDINDEYKKAIKKINDKIFSEFILMKHRTKNSEILKIYDSSFDSRDYNYAIPMNMYSVTDSYHVYFPCIQAYVERLCVNQPKEKVDNREEAFEEWVRGYIKLPIDSNGYFSLPDRKSATASFYDSFPSLEKSDYFFISSIDFRSQELIDHNFYFITNINEYMIKSSPYKIKNHDDLDKYLLNKARVEVDKYYRNVKFIYYNRLIDYVEDIAKRIFSIDLDLFIEFESDDLDVYRKNIECFNINADYIIRFLDGAINSQIQIYLMIERIITEFSWGLSNYGLKCAIDMHLLLSEKIIDAHMNKMKEYIDSDYLVKAIQHQQKSVEKYPWIYKLPKNDNTNLNGVKNPTLYIQLKKALERYYNFLKNGKQKTINTTE